jgi:putative transposase
MQKLEGEFAEYYNIRKRRSGAFWAGRYHCTMIGDGQYLWNCMKYIDLNMVRAGVVGHPQEWRWCGFSELTRLRQRYRMLDQAEVLRMHGDCTAGQFADNYRATIEEALALDPAAGAAARRA